MPHGSVPPERRPPPGLALWLRPRPLQTGALGFGVRSFFFFFLINVLKKKKKKNFRGFLVADFFVFFLLVYLRWVSVFLVFFACVFWGVGIRWFSSGFLWGSI